MFEIYNSGSWVGRVWNPSVSGPSLVTIRHGQLIDITSKDCPTMSELLDMKDPVGYLQSISGTPLCSLEEIFQSSPEDIGALHILAPCDLQAIKACGVTFAGSMVERVIEERAGGNPDLAQSIRDRIGDAISNNLSSIIPGSAEAMKLKEMLIAEGLWSQYLEVGIGPDAEVFSKAQVLSAVGNGARIGILQSSKWNNPEPEVVLAVSAQGEIRGATLGNDVNLRDIEGRSALLLSKAKDNNASCAIGPFIRLFDPTFSLDDVRKAELSLTVKGADGFSMSGHSSMSQISRDPSDLVAQTIGPNHQYPDGFMLFLGTLFAPTQDRFEKGSGFTHVVGDKVTISSPKLGQLENIVDYASNCLPWEFGTRKLMKNLSKRDLL